MRTEKEPHGLYEKAQLAELQRHGRRLQELRRGAKKLALLDLIAADLEAAGIPLYPSDLQICRDHIYVGGGFEQFTNKLAAWLVADGFKETYRHDYATFSSVGFSKGRLTLLLHVSAPQVAP